MNHTRSTALERSVKKLLGGLNRFYGRPTSPSASIMAQNIQLFGPRWGFLIIHNHMTTNYFKKIKYYLTWHKNHEIVTRIHDKNFTRSSLFINVTGISPKISRDKTFHEINMMLNLKGYLVNLIKIYREHDKIYDKLSRFLEKLMLT